MNGFCVRFDRLNDLRCKVDQGVVKLCSNEIRHLKFLKFAAENLESVEEPVPHSIIDRCVQAVEQDEVFGWLVNTMDTYLLNDVQDSKIFSHGVCIYHALVDVI